MAPSNRMRVLALLTLALFRHSLPGGWAGLGGAEFAGQSGFRDGRPAGPAGGLDGYGRAGLDARFALDRQIFLTGKASLKVEVPDTGMATVRQTGGGRGGRWYLVSVGYRSEGFGQRGKYSGVDANVGVAWHDAAGKEIGVLHGFRLPYYPRGLGPGRSLRVSAGRGRSVRPSLDGPGQSLAAADRHEHPVGHVAGRLPGAAIQPAAHAAPGRGEGAADRGRRLEYRTVQRPTSSPASTWPAASGVSILADPQATYDSVISSPAGVGGA